MNKKVGIITMDYEAGLHYKMNLQEVFEGRVEVKLYSVAKGTADTILPADLYLVSKGAIESCTELNLNLPMGIHVLDLQTDFTLENIRRLKNLPKGTKALLVNNTAFLVAEAVTRLQQMGIHNVEFYPVYPGMKETPPPYKIAVTPGEAEYVPKGVETMIDLGHRQFSPQMMAEVALELGLKEVFESKRFSNYTEKFDLGSYCGLHSILTKSLYLEDCFDVFIESLDDGVIGANENGDIFCFNKKAGEILDRDCEEMLGKSVLSELPFLPFLHCKEDLIPVENMVEKVSGNHINFSVKPILRDRRFKGVFATIQKFTDAERKQQEARMQILNKGHIAKYTFEHIIGNGEVLIRTKELAKRMAKTSFTILIYGESGTGKELFASAIHNASHRSKYPFIAINCAAMPETLLESELFGYEDGAFTGAKKGGKLGLFEFAHKGTLFLDEIENMSPALQVKLLRVLQEKEVMRVGGNQTISVDVRIIAATNEDLEVAVKNGTFRKDLYYRLSTLPILLPTLNQRREDVLLLFDYFKRQYEKDFELDAVAKNALINHNWDGNVRELQNYIEYFICLDKDLITISDLPKSLLDSTENKLQSDRHRLANTSQLREIAGKKSEEYQFALSVLYEGYQNRSNIGRNTIVTRAKEEGFYMTEQEVRTILNRLQEKGLVCISKGRGGSRLTNLGKELIESCENQ